MNKSLQKIAILGGVRTPFVKSLTLFKNVTSQEMMTSSVQALVHQQDLGGKLLGDVALGTIMKYPGDWNSAREVVLGTNLHPNTPGYSLARACGTGLDAINQIGLKIAAGQIEVGVGGGIDTNSDIPLVAPRSLVQKLIGLNSAKSILQKLSCILKFRLKDLKLRFPMVQEPRTGLSMGEHCELMVKEWKVSRQDQDLLAYESHAKAAKAYQSGFYKDLVLELKGVAQDPLVRADTTVEKLAKLKPAFDRSASGTLTAGNSTPLTDGASCVLLSSESWAKENNKKILAYLVDTEVAALDFVNGEGLLMAPTLAVARLLARNNLKLQDFDFYEIHEAFAGQVLCTLKAWQDPDYCKKTLGLSAPLGAIDRSKMNVKGGSLALGHPFSATGGRIVAGLAKILDEKGSGRGLISICTAGGMGIAAIVEK